MQNPHVIRGRDRAPHPQGARLMTNVTQLFNNVLFFYYHYFLMLCCLCNYWLAEIKVIRASLHVCVYLSR